MKSKSGLFFLLFACALTAGFMMWTSPRDGNVERGEHDLGRPATKPPPPPPATPSHSTTAPALTPSPTTIDKSAVLDEIIQSGNDNDPRMDTLLKNLSPDDHVMMEKKYANLPLESLNARGTLLFLLGREIRNQEDLAFISEVALSKPCLSLQNCQKSSGVLTIDHVGVARSILNYPQLVAAMALQKFLNSSPVDLEMRRKAEETLSRVREKSI